MTLSPLRTMKDFFMTRFFRSPRQFVALFTFSALLGAGSAVAGPQIEQWQSASGARVLFVESRALPMVDIQIDFAAGSAHEPAERAGLAGLVSSLLTAGTSTLDEQQIAERRADLGARIGTSTDDDRSSLSIRSLSSAEELEAAVQLAASLLADPAFPATVLERERGRSLTALRELLTKPAALAGRRFNALLYAGHPYGHTTTAETLQAISREDLVDFHRRHFGANRASIAIVGDLSRERAAALAEQLTRQLPALPPAAALPAPAAVSAHSEHLANPSAQAHILIGQPGMSRDDPDYFPLLVGNYILGGGGFVSRLTKEVREQRGFAYSVYSYLAPRQVAGPFQIGLQTRGSQRAAALEVVDQTLRQFIADGPSAEELQAAHDNLINGFGLRLDSNAKILDYVAMIGFYQLPLDWLDTYQGAVKAVDAEQVRSAFSRRIDPARLITVSAGGDGDTETAAQP